MSTVPHPSRHRRLRIALIIVAVSGALLWGGYEWLMSSAQSALNQFLTKRGLNLTYSSRTGSLWGSITLYDAALRQLSPGNDSLIEISELHVDVMWRESWNTRSAVTRWQTDDASLTLHDEEGAVGLHHFTADVALRGDKIDVASLGTRNGSLAFDLTGQILTTAASGTPTDKPFRLNLKPLRVVLNALELKSGTGLFTITGAFNLDLREASVIWRTKLHGSGKQVQWRGVPMQDAEISAGQTGSSWSNFVCQPQPTPLMNTTTTTTLNGLIQICKAGQDGFRDASENVIDSELKTLFSGYSLQRSKFAGDLQQLVIGLGEEPETSRSFASAMHRGWINLKAAFTKGSDHSILAECERGEDHAVSAYRNASAEELPANIRETVSTQSAAVQAAHDDIRDRRDACGE